jgi:hypothetical protein
MLRYGRAGAYGRLFFVLYLLFFLVDLLLKGIDELIHAGYEIEVRFAYVSLGTPAEIHGAIALKLLALGKGEKQIDDQVPCIGYALELFVQVRLVGVA